MSVIMMLRMQTDPALIERVASEQGDAIRAVSQRGRAAGAIHHAFYAGDDGAAYVIDEWDSPESFRSFFESEQPNIGPLMQAAGVEGEPEIRFFEKLSTGDDF